MAERWDELASGLTDAGWWWCPGFLPPTEAQALRAELLAQRHLMIPAAIGRGNGRQLDPAERGDLTRWLDGSAPAQQRFLARMETLRLALNQRLQLGLFDYEAHYACYPTGAGYRRHYDAFRGRASRVLSTAFYLNEDWLTADGGELVLWNESGGELARLLPGLGDAVFFLSERFPHAVLPAMRERYSIAGWFHHRR